MHPPRAARQLLHGGLALGVAIQVAPAVDVADEQQRAVGERREVLVPVDPRALRLLVDAGRLARRGVAREDLQRVLAPVHPLHEQGAAVDRPLREGQVVIGLLLEVHPRRPAVGDRDDADADVRVRVAGLGVAGALERAVLAVGVVDREHRDRRVVEAHERQARPVRRPPERVAAAAEDLLHVDPRRRAVQDRLAAVGGELALEAGREVEGEQVVVADVGEAGAVRREADVLLRRRGWR